MAIKKIFQNESSVLAQVKENPSSGCIIKPSNKRQIGQIINKTVPEQASPNLEALWRIFWGPFCICLLIASLVLSLTSFLTCNLKLFFRDLSSTFVNQDKCLLSNVTSNTGSEAVTMQETHEMLSSQNIICQNPDEKI